jgi:hypothetical protein
MGVAHQCELVAADLELNVERLLEVRVDTEQVGPPPPLGLIEVGSRVDDGAESFECDRHTPIVASGRLNQPRS